MLKRLQGELLDVLIKVLRKQHRLKPGDRVGVAVSGGADSVALQCALNELHSDLGIVLSVLHFHHGIRGAEADQDEAFVVQLAQSLGLKCVAGRGDVPTHARNSRQSLETAARELRYQFFDSVLRSETVDKIATAHTMDDQAETVLMRTLRGAGSRGLTGIHPERDDGRFLRPLLGVRRRVLEDYLRSLGQDWRDDASNTERKHFRNQVRHDLLPMLAKDFNPNIVAVLARSAAVAQSEEEYWSREIARLLPLVLLPGKPTRGGGRSTSLDAEQTVSFNLEVLHQHPLAVQRRLLWATLRERGVEVDSDHIEALLEITRGDAKAAELPGGWKATRSFRELRLEPPPTEAVTASGYTHPLRVPGESQVREISLLVQARLEPIPSGGEGYNSGQVVGELLLADGLTDLTVRNWQSGDRFWPEHSKSAKKVKEILQQLKVPSGERSYWPVVAAGDELIWVRGAAQRRVRVRFQERMCRLIIDTRELEAGR